MMSHRQQQQSTGKRDGSHHRRGDDSSRQYDSMMDASAFSLDHQMRSAGGQKGGNQEKNRMSLNSMQNVSLANNHFQNAILETHINSALPKDPINVKRNEKLIDEIMSTTQQRKGAGIKNHKQISGKKQNEDVQVNSKRGQSRGVSSTIEISSSLLD